MAYVNVAEWSPENVAEWLKGLEYSLLPYVHFFLNNEIDGSHLLNLTADDLEDLHIFKVGHQQLILEAVELLRQLHYGLTSETLQSLAVKLGCKARSLYNDLKLNGPQDHIEHARQERVSTNVLSAVSQVLTSVKAVISWLDRPPFQRDPACAGLKKAVLKLSIELASTTQRDQFAERPHDLIKKNSLHLAELCDKFIQDSKDSLILQPASLDIALIKKKPDEELGIHIKSTYSGVHIIGGIKDQSPAKRCNKVEKGDEIVQVNYQTVIGWQQKKLVTAMTEHSTELHLTIKKRPRHVNILGEVIILRPYRIPSKKFINKCHKWSEDHQLRGQDNCSTSNESECLRDDFNDDEDDSAFLPPDAPSTNHLLLAKDMSLHRHLHPGNPQAAVQRRATVSGASPTVSKPPVNIEDLVNGVPRIKNSETFGRSMSHDPSYILSSKNCSEKSNDLKHDSSSENGAYSQEFGSSEDCSEAKDFNLSSPPIATDTVKISNEGKIVEGENTPTPLVEVLPVQEDECAIFENKSLNGTLVNTNDDAVSEKSNAELLTRSDRSNISATTQTASNYVDPFVNKPNIVLYNWEGVDTVFQGRRPSAHDISNEIAGSTASEINPVYLRKSSKIQSPPSSQESSQAGEDAKSYQVVVVGGVPQKCPTSTKEAKDKSYLHRKENGRNRKLGNRYISCKNLGKGDCEGYLYKQREKKGFFPSGHQWVRRWIVLKNHLLYIYRDLNDLKAECLISLPGAYVSQAFDCKTKKFAFKICQQRAKFYFASDSFEDIVRWMNKMGLAAISYHSSSCKASSGFLKADLLPSASNKFYSETDDSEGESSLTAGTRENNDLSTSSSSFEQLFDQSSATDCQNRLLNSSQSKCLASAYSKTKKHYQTNKEFVANWIKQRAQATFVDIRNDGSSSADSVPSVDLYSSPNENYDQHNQHILCNRSLSCTETSYCHFKSDSQNLVRKMSYESNVGNQSVKNQPVPLSHIVDSHLKYPDQLPTCIDEEYDMLTSSLGRQQKPVAKEITPGLVARMAVSYSNLTQKNTSNSHMKKSNHQKGVPAPGYVAKISDSFDQFAKSGNSRAFACSKYPVKRGKNTSNNRNGVIDIQASSYKRSASESQVSKKFNDISHGSENSPDTYFTNSSVTANKMGIKKSNTEKFVSLLDQEYNKVFEGKKVSQRQLKSQSKSSLQTGIAASEMRFFPNSSVSEFTNLPKCSKSMSVHGERDLSMFSSKSLKNSSNFKTWFDDSEKTKNITDSKSCQSHEFSLSKSSISQPYSSQMHYKDLNSSEGIENIGFRCVDQASDEFESHMSTSPKELEQKISQGNRCVSDSSFPISDNVSNEPCSPRASAFKFFNSPKFMKKLTSPKLDKKNIFKSKKQAREKKAEQKEISQLQSDKKFFGSPRLVRAIFGSPKAQKKVTVSSAVQTDQISLTHLISEAKSFHDLNRNDSFVSDIDYRDTVNPILEPQEQDVSISKSSSNSSLNSNVSNSLSPFSSSLYYVEAKIKPQITISLPYVADKDNECKSSEPETPRTPLKPTMGVAMLSKKRLPSLSGESSVSVSSSKSSHDESIKEVASIRSEVSMEINGESDFLQALESLQRVNLSSDNIDLSTSISKSSLED